MHPMCVLLHSTSCVVDIVVCTLWRGKSHYIYMFFLHILYILCTYQGLKKVLGGDVLVWVTLTFPP